MPVNRRPGSPNSLFSEDEFGLADVGKLIKEHLREPAALREMRLRLERAQTSISAINSLEAAQPGISKNTAFAKQLRASQRAEANLMPKIGLYEATRQERTSAQAVNSIGREFSESSVGSYIARHLNSMEVQGGGFAAASNVSFSELRKRQAGIRGEMGRVRQRALNSAENLYDEEGNIDEGSVRKMHKSQVRFKGLANELTAVSASLNQAKREGRDPQSRLLALTKAQQNAAGVLNTNSIEEQMKSGVGLGAMSPRDLKQKETEASVKLMKAMDDLRKSFGKGEEIVEKFAENAEKAAKELEDVQEAQGMGGGGGSRYEDIKTIVGSVQEALNVITSGYQNVAINQPMQMVQNIAGTANLENEKYNMWHAAIAGDMTARMTLGAWDTAEAFGQQQFGRQGNVHIGRIVTSGLGAGLGVLQAGVGVAQAAGGVADVVGVNPIENIAQGAKSGISGAVGIVEEASALARHTDQTRVRIDATHAIMAAAKAINHIPGQQLQKYRDYVMGINEAASEMGGATGEAFLNETSGTDFLTKMRIQGVGLKEMGALSAQGAAAAGSMFQSGNVLDAVRLENAGFGSSTENIRRMGILGAAGTQDPGTNLSKLIEEGMQRGLNSSKAIDMIVENTARMTEETAVAGGGADPTGLIDRILSGIDRNNPNKEMAEKIAFQTYYSEEGARHNISTSFPGMINVARVQKELGLGGDLLGSAVLTQIPTAMLNAYKGKSPEALKNFLEGRGISHTTIANMDQSLFQNDKLINILNTAGSVAELAQQSGVGYATGRPGAFMDLLLKNRGNEKKLNALLAGNDPNALTNEERTLREGLAAPASLGGKNFAAMARNAAVLAGIDIPKETNKTIDEMLNQSRLAAQIEKRGGNQAEIDQAIRGGSGLGAEGTSGAEGIHALARSLRVAFEKAGQDAETRWTTAASNAAASFGASTTSLNHASGNLDKAAQYLADNAALTGVVSKSFGAMIDKWTKDIKRTTDEVVTKLRSKL